MPPNTMLTFDYAPHYREMRRMTCGTAAPELLNEHIPLYLRPASMETIHLEVS